MKCFNQIALCMRIEYHWWRISQLKKRQASKKKERLLYCENLHRYKAERLAKIYEISLGMRDFNGNIIA